MTSTLSRYYPVSKCASASIVMTSTLRVKVVHVHQKQTKCMNTAALSKCLFYNFGEMTFLFEDSLLCPFITSTENKYQTEQHIQKYQCRPTQTAKICTTSRMYNFKIAKKIKIKKSFYAAVHYVSQLQRDKKLHWKKVCSLFFIFSEATICIISLLWTKRSCFNAMVILE